MGTKVTAIYNEGVIKLMEKVDLPEKAKVRITISVNFSKLLDEVGEIEAKEDIDKVLGNMLGITMDRGVLDFNSGD